MKSILFLLKLSGIGFIFFTIFIYIEEAISYGYNDEFDVVVISIIFFIILIILKIHQIGKKYKWDNDFLFLLLVTSYKKYTNYLSSSKDRMREQLKNKDN